MEATETRGYMTNTDRSGLTRRIERKYYIVPRNFAMAHTMLRQICRPDREFPSEQINSLYFDTGDLDQHERSLSGEYRKDKVRIRWYGRDEDHGDTVTAFLELKSREGFTSTKQRLKLEIPAKDLSVPALGKGIIPRTEIMSTLADFGYYPGRPLWPVIKISYWRYRFTEMMIGMRVALDCHIRSTIIMPGIGRDERELELPGAVIEVKGTRMELPLTIRKMKIMDLDWSRFSKYSSCIDSHGEELGTVGRLSPSGKVI
jgi:hypothetical protein